MKGQFSGFFKHTGVSASAAGQNGSVILVVLMLLVILSVIGISSTNTTVTENYIVRNTAIRKQNLHLVDSVAREVYQIIVDAAGYENPNDPNEFIDFDRELRYPNDTNLVWFHDLHAWEGSPEEAAWYNPTHIGRILDTTNSGVPQSIINGDIGLISERNEWTDEDHSPIRFAFAGWKPVEEGGESIGVNKPGSEKIEIGNIFVEYVSEKYGVIRLIMGVKTRTG